MRRAPFASLVLAAALMTASPRASGDDRATELLERARAALGGPALAQVTSFQAEGTSRRQVGDRQIDGDLEIAVELPGRFLRTETITMGGETMGRRYVGLNGEESLDAMVGGPGGGDSIIRAPPGVAPEQAQAMMRRRTQRELSPACNPTIRATPSSDRYWQRSSVSRIRRSSWRSTSTPARCG